MAKSLPTILLLLLLGGCKQAAVQPVVHPEPPPAHAFVDANSIKGTSTMLFFGLSKPNGGQISDSEFEGFVAREIATRFPDGFTILRGDGHWREGGHDYAEPSRILWLVHDGSAETNAKLEQLRNLYRRQFNQTSVLRTDQAPTYISY